ncbi:MAG TPA: hypothetical protein VGI20_09415, partial [Rhizomicrobium sp.]
MHSSLVAHARNSIPLDAVRARDLEKYLRRKKARESGWLRGAGFAAKEGEIAFVPSGKGEHSFAVLGLGNERDPLALAAFAESLPQGTYALRDVPDECGGAQAALGWLLGTYHFDRYRKRDRNFPKLVAPHGIDVDEITRIAEGVFLARDLVNTPSNDMGPAELSDVARALAGRC